LLYADEESDITDLVLDKLGIKAPDETAPAVEEKPAAPAKPAGTSTPVKKAPVKK
jgi:hypothetical protein